MNDLSFLKGTTQITHLCSGDIDSDETMMSKEQKPISEYTMDTNGLDLTEIVGQEQAVREMQMFIQSIKYRASYKAWSMKSPKGILLTGKPGTGKTAAVRALAKELGDSVVLMELRYLDIASKWVDAPIEHLRSFFTAAEEFAQTKHVIVFIDEIDAMIPQRTDTLHETSAKKVDVFLEWMDGGFRSISNITVIGATNNLEGVDAAARRPGRMDKIVHFNDLTGDAIIAGLQVHLNKRKLGPRQITTVDWQEIRKSVSDGYLSGADLPEVVNRVVADKIQQHISAVLLAHPDYDSLSKNYQKKIFKSYKYMPQPISTEDFVRTIAAFIKERPPSRIPGKIGFSLSAAQ